MSGSVNKVISDMYTTGLQSIPQIARAVDVPRSRVRGILISEGIERRSRADGVRLRRDVLGKHAKGKHREFTQEWKENIRQGKLKHGESHARGLSIKQSGYVEHTRGANKGRCVHAVLMEKRIGRHLLPDECVHHIDGNRSNNAPNNLALVTRSGHMRLHRREQKLQRGLRS